MCHQIEQLTSAEASGNGFVLKRIPVSGSWYLQKQKDIKFGGSFRENQELEIFRRAAKPKDLNVTCCGVEGSHPHNSPMVSNVKKKC